MKRKLGILLARWRPSGTATRFSSSVILLQCATIGCNLVILRWLPPAEIGLWQSLLLIGVYAGILDGGVISGLDRELPSLLAKGRVKRQLSWQLPARQWPFLVQLCAFSRYLFASLSLPGLRNEWALLRY